MKPTIVCINETAVLYFIRGHESQDRLLNTVLLHLQLGETRAT